MQDCFRFLGGEKRTRLGVRAWVKDNPSRAGKATSDGDRWGFRFWPRDCLVVGDFGGFHWRKVVNEQAKQTGGDAPKEDEIAGLILSYLAEHPQAMDTVEGIAEWWVMRERARHEVETVMRVLRRLTERGLIEVCGDRARPCYRLKSGVGD